MKKILCGLMLIVACGSVFAKDARTKDGSEQKERKCRSDDSDSKRRGCAAYVDGRAAASIAGGVAAVAILAAHGDNDSGHGSRPSSP